MASKIQELNNKVLEELERQLESAGENAIINYNHSGVPIVGVVLSWKRFPQSISIKVKSSTGKVYSILQSKVYSVKSA